MTFVWFKTKNNYMDDHNRYEETTEKYIALYEINHSDRRNCNS